jgi:phospholipid/cholesterol/gamma-HCH transport system substrate-binding protein
MRERAGVEIKVGLLALIGFIILAVLIFSIGDYNLFQKRKEINLLFSFAGGVALSAPVNLSGVKIGEVKKIQLIYNEAEQKTGVQITVWLDQEVVIYDDADVFINTLGLLGEKYIEILNSGSSSNPMIQEGDTIRGHDPVPIEQLTKNTHRIVEKLDHLIEGLNDVVGDDEVKKSLKSTIYNLESVTAHLKHVTGQIRSGEGSVGHFVYNDSLYNELEGFAKEIRRNPWKLLKRGKTKDSKEDTKDSELDSSNKGFIK